MRSLTILGSTGSIGLSTLRVARAYRDEFTVRGLACRSNLVELENQIAEFSPEAVAIVAKEAYCSNEFLALKKNFPSVHFFEGEEGLLEFVKRDTDILVSAIVGAAGLKPTLTALPHVRRLALANKETLVMSGEIFMSKVRDFGVELIPIDSEHNAIFLLLDMLPRKDVHRIILTASGGSLRGKKKEELEQITPQEALAHPTWEMGNKITIDSSTLMNKGLEVIEAHHLFGLSYDEIDVIIHPESIIHSLVETVDGAIYAHMGVTDMVFPILNALFYPEKRTNPFGRLNLAQLGTIHFFPYDSDTFPALNLCYRAGRMGGTATAVLNAANEECVYAFLRGELKLPEIVKIVEKIIDEHTLIPKPGLEEILQADNWAREKTRAIISYQQQC
ncbi:MAG: 1-deoxy-D-xylulose-5-phosphate reductoisomerase [Spirochaetes bacterium]|nr:1-deoxy-D-xylulose-5-phosphate reductoisomerase [Spirochaetota bacterium]